MACAKARRVAVCMFLGWEASLPGGWIRKGYMDGDRQREKEDGYGGLLVVLIWFLNTIPAPGMQAWGLRNPILLIRLCILVKASPAG